MIPDARERTKAVMTPGHAFVWASAGTAAEIASARGPAARCHVRNGGGSSTLPSGKLPMKNRAHAPGSSPISSDSRKVNLRPSSSRISSPKA